MEKPSYDPGLTQQYGDKLRRVIRKDGQFNVRRRGTTWRDIHPYLYLINLPWPVFLTVVFAGFVAANLLFALGYCALGVESLHGAEAPTAWGRFINAFFFSSQTITTVGYGTIVPESPSARIGFSDSMIVAPYGGGSSLQFRIVNRNVSNLMEVEARMLLMTVEKDGERLERRYAGLDLERDRVLFMPLTWTIVHPIDADSPLFGKTAADLARSQAEVLILVKGVDDTFSQTVYARYSYRFDEIAWSARFAPAFEVDADGDLRLDLDKVSELAGG